MIFSVIAGALFISAFCFAIVLPPTACAYSTNDTGAAARNPITAPFEDFYHSINSVGNILPGSTTPQMRLSIPTTNGFVTTNVQDALSQFDNWLYGIAGFHVLELFTAILSVLSWLLGIVKGGVDWLLGWAQ